MVPVLARGYSISNDKMSADQTTVVSKNLYRKKDEKFQNSTLIKVSLLCNYRKADAKKDGIGQNIDMM